MPDFVISGASGFIGTSLMSAFTEAGFTSESYDMFRESDAVATTFVHCANVYADPAQNAALTADVLSTVAPRIKRFVQLQTFATLHGSGSLDAARFNFGKVPLLMASYGHGKLSQERVICSSLARFPVLALRLLYMPVVLGGGVWAEQLEQAKRHGVRLPPLMSKQARANHIHVDDLSRHLIESQGDSDAGIKRTILNRAESRTLTWPEFFKGTDIRYETSPKNLTKLGLTLASLAAYRGKMLLSPDAIPVGQSDRRPPRAVKTRAEEPPPARPLRFSGLIQQIVRLQPFLAAR
jgi:hypothetical protein